MARFYTYKCIITCKAAEPANKTVIYKATLKHFEFHLSIEPPFLYNHIKGRNDLQRGYDLWLDAAGERVLYVILYFVSWYTASL